MRFRFIDHHRRRWPIEVMCRVLAVSRSGYYAWRRRPMSARRCRCATLLESIRQAHRESRGIYGSPRIHRDLRARGIHCSRNTVATLMRHHHLRSRLKRRFVVRTTDSRHAHPIARNLLQRRFHWEHPNRAWCCDLTYVPTDEGWLYLAVVLDLCSRKVIGWSMADHLRSELVEEALRMALAQRRPRPGVMHHSDRGVQYACESYRDLLAAHGMIASMSGAGDCLDNAVAERFMGALKTEWVHHQRYATRQQARLSVFEYIEVFYNRKRRHSTLGYVSPEEYERTLD
jgi:transposase InsO family protein